METRPRVIVAEDNEIFAALISETLQEEFDVSVVHNGLQCISLCLEKAPDAIVTDIGMPDFDGVEMLKQFQKDRRFSSIPVLVLTVTHFTNRDKNVITRFPQVKAVLDKSTSISTVAQEVRKMLHNVPAPGPRT